MQRILSALTLAVVAALTLTACGGGSSGADRGSDANEADVTFTRSMVPHHEQAVEMAKLARTRALDPRVKRLAARIEAAQGPEITTMQGWLKKWGAPESDSSTGGTDHGDSGMDSMPGMMSDSDMEALGQATGPAFDRMFLSMMIGHHSGAIDMARTERAEGEDADAKALARDIEKAQAREITEMKKILGS